MHFRVPSPSPPPSREIGMHEGWGRTGRETYMDVFIHDVNKVYITLLTYCARQILLHSQRRLYGLNLIEYLGDNVASVE